MSNTPKTFEGLKDLCVREQLLELVSKPLSVFLKERKPETVKEMSELADQYHEAHKDLQNGEDDRKCFVCRGNHLARNCPKQTTNRASALLSDRNRQQMYVRDDDWRVRHDRRSQSEMSFRNAYHQRSGQMANACLGMPEKCGKEEEMTELFCGHELPVVSAACYTILSQGVRCQCLTAMWKQNMPLLCVTQVVARP